MTQVKWTGDGSSDLEPHHLRDGDGCHSAAVLAFFKERACRICEGASRSVLPNGYHSVPLEWAIDGFGVLVA